METSKNTDTFLQNNKDYYIGESAPVSRVNSHEDENGMKALICSISKRPSFPPIYTYNNIQEELSKSYNPTMYMVTVTELATLNKSYVIPKSGEILTCSGLSSKEATQNVYPLPKSSGDKATSEVSNVLRIPLPNNNVRKLTFIESIFVRYSKRKIVPIN